MTHQKTCRLLYFGPAEAGKRANLRYIHQSIPPEHLLSLVAKDPERQIAFKVAHGDDGQWQVLVQALDSGKIPSRFCAFLAEAVISNEYCHEMLDCVLHLHNLMVPAWMLLVRLVKQ